MTANTPGAAADPHCPPQPSGPQPAADASASWAPPPQAPPDQAASGGHRPPLPVGQRVRIGFVPPHLRPRPAAPPSARGSTRRRTLLVSAVTAAIVLATAGVVVVRSTAEDSPREVVAAFFAALTAHDTTVLSTGRCDRNPLCEPDALRAGYEAPQHVAIGGETGTGHTRHVAVTYTVDDQHASTVIDLEGHSSGPFSGRTWIITTAPGGTLTPPEHTPAPIRIAGADLPAAAAMPRGGLWAPPGRYILTRPATPLLEEAHTTITVTSDTTQAIALPADVKPDVAAATEQLIHNRIDSCAAQRSFTPAVGPPPAVHSCPIRYDVPYTSTDDPTWTVHAYPKLDLQPADDGTIIVTTTTPGTADVRYRWTRDIIEPRTWNPVTDTVTLTVSGLITTANGTLAWQPS